MAELNISKVFVLVPSTVENFNGATISANDSKIYFDVKNSLIWAKGKSYGLSNTIKGDYDAKFSTLIGEFNGDASKSVRVIAQEVVDATIGIGEDSTEKIDRLKEVLDFFNDVSEGETGVALLANVAANTAAIGIKASEAVGEPGETGYKPAVSATGLYKYVDDKVADKNVNANGETGDNALISASAVNNVVSVASTSKLQDAVLLAESSIQGLTISSYTLNKTNNSVSTAQLKTDILGDLSATYTGKDLSSNENISVTVTSAEGNVSSVSVNASTLVGRVKDTEDAIKDWDPWTTYQE